jgi:hypothetical protein
MPAATPFLLLPTEEAMAEQNAPHPWNRASEAEIERGTSLLGKNSLKFASDATEDMASGHRMREMLLKLNTMQAAEANLSELNRIGGVSRLASILHVNIHHGLTSEQVGLVQTSLVQSS